MYGIAAELAMNEEDLERLKNQLDETESPLDSLHAHFKRLDEEKVELLAPNSLEELQRVSDKAFTRTEKVSTQEKEKASFKSILNKILEYKFNSAVLATTAFSAFLIGGLAFNYSELENSTSEMALRSSPSNSSQILETDNHSIKVQVIDRQSKVVEIIYLLDSVNADYILITNNDISTINFQITTESAAALAGLIDLPQNVDSVKLIVSEGEN